MKVNEIVRNRIIELCTLKRWSYYSVARYSGIPLSTMNNIIYKKSKNIGIVTIKKICDGLEISLEEFFSTEEFRSLEQEIE